MKQKEVIKDLAQPENELDMDITYCGEEDCPLHNTCKRYYKGDATRWQFVNDPRNTESLTPICNHYWPI